MASPLPVVRSSAPRSSCSAPLMSSLPARAKPGESARSSPARPHEMTRCRENHRPLHHHQYGRKPCALVVATQASQMTVPGCGMLLMLYRELRTGSRLIRRPGNGRRGPVRSADRVVLHAGQAVDRSRPDGCRGVEAPLGPCYSNLFRPAFSSRRRHPSKDSPFPLSLIRGCQKNHSAAAAEKRSLENPSPPSVGVYPQRTREKKHVGSAWRNLGSQWLWSPCPSVHPILHPTRLLCFQRGHFPRFPSPGCRRKSLEAPMEGLIRAALGRSPAMPLAHVPGLPLHISLPVLQ